MQFVALNVAKVELDFTSATFARNFARNLYLVSGTLGCLFQSSPQVVFVFISRRVIRLTVKNNIIRINRLDG